MPTNLYGPNDNFDLKTSHVLPALIRKFHEAKLDWRRSKPGQRDGIAVVVWGTGIPRREFLHVDDLADACLFIMNTIEAADIFGQGVSHVNIGTGQDIRISELCSLMREIVGYEGSVVFDTDKPDGTPQKKLDVKRLEKLGWKSKISLHEGLKMTYGWYLDSIKAG
jgi:GDP-L-fucose synthase